MSKFILLFMDTNTPKNQITEYWISLKSYSDNGMRHNVGLFPLQSILFMTEIGQSALLRPYVKMSLCLVSTPYGMLSVPVTNIT